MKSEKKQAHQAAEMEDWCNELQKNLVQSEDRFKKLFHASSNLMMITTIKDGRILDVNEASAKFGGYKREELIGRLSSELGLLADSSERGQLIAGMKSANPRNQKVRVRRKDGEIRTVLLSADPIILNDEPCILSVSVDITEEEEEEKALRESEQKYRTVVENSLQGLAILQDGCFVFCNQAFANMMGYSIKKLLSISAEEMLNLVHPDDQLLMLSRHHDRLAGKPVPARYEYRGIRKDGTEVWLEAFASPIEYHGKLAVQSAYVDVTERKKAEKALKESEEALKNSAEYVNQIINCLGDSIFVKDDKHRFLVVNDASCAFMGKKREELLGQTNLESLPKELAKALAEREQHLLETGRESVSEESLPDGHGRKHTVMTKTTLLTDKNGSRQIVGLMRDITEYKLLQAQFLQSQKMEAIGVLAGGIAHDFNNLLTVIRGYTELLLEDYSPTDSKRRDLEEIGKAAQRANSLTSQLLAFSRKQILQPELLNLSDSLIDMDKMIRRLIGEDIDLAIIAHSDLGLVHADPGQIQQIIMNLVINARDAMPMGGKLTIETANMDFDDPYVDRHPGTAKGAYVMLAISDNGLGMDSETQARIFEPFYTTKGKGKGTGLGLSTVYGIVKQSNGFIWVYSEPGKGSTFKIYFPRREGESARSESEIHPESRFRGSETVLIAEDEAPVRALASRILRERGYKVLEAPNGMEALRIGSEYSGPIHLVLTDAIMPGISGSTLVSRLEVLRPGIQALFVSGYTDNSIVHHGILDSNVNFLQKPFTVEGLARKVWEVLNSA